MLIKERVEAEEEKEKVAEVLLDSSILLSGQHVSIVNCPRIFEPVNLLARNIACLL